MLLNLYNKLPRGCDIIVSDTEKDITLNVDLNGEVHTDPLQLCM